VPYAREVSSKAGKTYLSLRISAPALLVIHLIIRLVFPTPGILADLFLFNLIGFLASLIAFRAPQMTDRWAKDAIAGAIFIWSIGSTISTWDSFYNLEIAPGLTDICYAFFYPLMLFGIIRALAVAKKIVSLELLDTVIVALGTSSVIATLLLRPAMIKFAGSPESVFLSILYPIGDIVLVAITISLILIQPRTVRTISLLIGIVIFSVTDLLFLLLSATSGYTFASITDDGWLLGLVLISESLFHHGGLREISDRIASVATTISLILSSLILAIAALRPNYFPKLVLIPAFATITLAFLRMALALRDARHVTLERELARTDELTGLPNRRRFLVELELLRRKAGTLLLLDLDGFKLVNDEYGHVIGDELLKQIATRFTRAIPDGVLLARLGGDEFGVIIYGEANYALEVALALRATVTYPFDLSVGPVRVGVSIGSVLNDQATESIEDLLRRADSSMYEAKRTGLGLVQWQQVN